MMSRLITGGYSQEHMYNYKIVIQYDGARYNGWQRQGNTKNTIQEKIEEVIHGLTGMTAEVISSGRTDAGVHALAQTANFKSEEKLACPGFICDLNRYLPKDIRILSMEEADIRFHARLNAKKKTYVYRIDNTLYGSVFDRKYSMRFNERLDINKMRAASAYYVGEHDFKSFCTKKSMKKSTVRTIYSVDIEENNGIIEIVYCGNGFLYNMVRILTGTLMEVGRGNIDPDSIPAIIESGDRKNAGFTAQPEGLFLKSVEY